MGRLQQQHDHEQLMRIVNILQELQDVKKRDLKQAANQRLNGLLEMEESMNEVTAEYMNSYVHGNKFRQNQMEKENLRRAAFYNKKKWRKEQNKYSYRKQFYF